MSASLLVLVPDTVRPCVFALPEMEFRGLWFNEAGVVYGELQDVGETPPGEAAPGDRRLNEVAVVALEGAMDMVEM